MTDGNFPIRKGYVETSLGQVHYRRAGRDGATPLVLLHQAPESSTMWTAVLPGFAEKGYLAIAPDLPGHGQSYFPEKEPDLAALSEGALAAVKALGLDEPVDYVGHHTGAGVALWIAAKHPSSVRRLALWGIPLLNEEWREKLANEEPPTYSDDGSEIAELWKNISKWVPNVNLERRLDFLVSVLQTKETRPWAHRAIGRADVKSLIQEVKQPVLAIASEEEMLGEATRESVPLFENAVYCDISGASVDVADTHGPEFIEAIHNFLTKE